MPRSGGSAKKAKRPAKAEKTAGKAGKREKVPLSAGKSVKAVPLEITELRRANDVSPRLGCRSCVLWGIHARTRTHTQRERARARASRSQPPSPNVSSCTGW